MILETKIQGATSPPWKIFFFNQTLQHRIQYIGFTFLTVLGVKKYNSDVITMIWGQIISKGQNKYNFQLFAIENVAFVVTILTLVSKSTSESRIF